MYSATPQPPPIGDQMRYPPAPEGCYYGPPSCYADVIVRPGELEGDELRRAERISALSMPTQRAVTINKSRIRAMQTQRGTC